MEVSCNHENTNCICETVKSIEAIQTRMNKKCSMTQCNDFQAPLGMKNDCNTIPIMLLCKGMCDYFIASGIFKCDETMSFNCFHTPVFRVSKVLIDSEQCCVVLELLQPQCKDGLASPICDKEDVCNFFASKKINHFIRTGICIQVDLSCFCGIECLPHINARCEKPKAPPSPLKTKIIQEEICGNFQHGNHKVWEAPLGMYLDATFEIYNSAQSTSSVHAHISANPPIAFPNVPPGSTMTRSTISPTTLTIKAPTGTYGKYCIKLIKKVMTPINHFECD